MACTITGTLKKIFDKTQQVYWGVDLHHEQINCFLEELRMQGINEEYISLKMKRDNGFFHITVVPTMFMNLIKDRALEKFLLENEGNEFSFEVFGIGTASATKNDITKQAWFIVCENEELQKELTSLNMKRDFHVTLAFNPTDVFQVSKGKDSIIYPVTTYSSKKKIK